MSSFTLGGGSSLVIDSSNGPVEIYTAGDWDISGDSAVRTTSESAREFQLFIGGDTDSGADPATVSLNANTVLHGAIYAPDASISVPADFELFGSLIARSLTFGEAARLHFDESLLYESDEETLSLETLIWRPVSSDGTPRVRHARRLTEARGPSVGPLAPRVPYALGSSAPDCSESDSSESDSSESDSSGSDSSGSGARMNQSPEFP